MELGEVCYNAYSEMRDWKTVNGQPIPTWDNQAPELRDAWRVAACAVANTVSRVASNGIEALLIGAVSGACVTALIYAVLNALR